MGDLKGGIIFGDDSQGLGIVRALTEGNIPNIVLSWEKGIARYSRYVDKVIHISPPYEEEHFYDDLNKIISKYGLSGWVAYPTDDDSVKFISKYSKDIGINAWGLSKEQHDTVVDKYKFYKLLTKLGIRTPKTIEYTDLNDKSQLCFPAIIKPRVKEPFIRLTKKKAIKVESMEHLHKSVDSLNKRIPRNHLTIQELIPGDGSNQFSYAALLQKGQPLADLTACRRRQHPHDFGRASTFVYTLEDDEVRDMGIKILSHLEYSGLAEVEFKRHQDTQHLYLLEINPRTWGWHTIVRTAHFNWISALHSIMQKQKIDIPSHKCEANWVRLITDLPSAMIEVKDGRLKIKDLIKDYFNKPKSFAVWDKKDPLPFVMEWFLLPYLILKRGY
jgi:predicted ATP-grasp superfamily ATP-dependent carboligase